jgi:hypothetical protein
MLASVDYVNSLNRRRLYRLFVDGPPALIPGVTGVSFRSALQLAEVLNN